MTNKAVLLIFQQMWWSIAIYITENNPPNENHCKLADFCSPKKTNEQVLSFLNVSVLYSFLVCTEATNTKHKKI